MRAAPLARTPPGLASRSSQAGNIHSCEFVRSKSLLAQEIRLGEDLWICCGEQMRLLKLAIALQRHLSARLATL
jgi:hypothetical protein